MKLLRTSPYAPVGRLASVAVTIVFLFVAFSGCTSGAQEGVLRLGYFPNLTHAQALYGVATGLYQEKLGATKLVTQSFNAGPAAFEALLSRQVDVIYVGPSPTISALEKTGLDVIVIVAGAASGGAKFVVREDVKLDDDAALGGKKFATPQRGNTQDVALKYYLKKHGHKTTDQGGDVTVVNAQNPDILSLFQQKQVDGAWLPEPWATRLVLEGGGKVKLDEKEEWPDGKFVTTHMVTTRAFLEQRHEDLEKLLEAHAEATKALQAGSDDTLKSLNDGIEKATGKRLNDATLKAAFPNILFTQDPVKDSFKKQYQMSFELGFAEKEAPSDLDRIYDLSHVATFSEKPAPKGSANSTVAPAVG